MCLLAKPLPTEDDWTRGYFHDADTRKIIERFCNSKLKGQRWTKKELSKVDPAYRQPLQDGLIVFVCNQLCYFQPTQTNRRAILLIIPLSSMRHGLFDAYHATPVAGHMGVYKTLHWLRLWFFWQKMRQLVIDWVTQCAHCVLANSTCHVSTKLLYSFLPDEPFAVIHVDLWSPGETVSFRGTKCQMVAMDDVTGTVLVVNVDNAVAKKLARLFFKHVLLVVGICCVMAVDTDSKFCALFELMCKVLGLKFHALAKNNHKAMRVERFNRFLNKVVTIESNNHDTNQMFAEAAHVAAYAWNLAPIDRTDIVCSYAAFGRVFRFPMDVALGDMPTPMTDNATAVTQFLEGMAAGRTVATHILQILREERATAYREQVNETRNQREFNVGDRVMAWVQVQSNVAAGKVAKILYKCQGSFVVVEVLGKGAYHLRQEDHLTGALQQHLAEDMFLLPKALHPCELFDSMDFRYMNFDRAPQQHPLHDALGIEAYNLRHLGPDDGTVTVEDSAMDAVSHSFQSIAELSCLAASLPPTDLAHREEMVDAHVAAQRDPAALTNAISWSRDKLFFISYAPEGTLRKRWYLVCPNLDDCKEVAAARDYALTGKYVVNFFVKVLHHRSRSDLDSRWWPEWREFHLSHDGEMELGARVEFAPNRKPDLHKYTTYSDVVDLVNEDVTLLGPFDFDDAAGHWFRNCIPASVWYELRDAMQGRGVAAPMPVEPTRLGRSRHHRALALLLLAQVCT